MNKIIKFILPALLLLPAAIWAQSTKGVLSGRVTDAIDGSHVVGATIYLPELKEGVTTDTAGYYIMKDLPKKKTVVQVSYVGHQTIIKDVDLSRVKKLDFVLKESNATLGEVVVTGLTQASLMKNTPSAVQMVTSEELNHSSFNNIIDAVAHQPGVSQVTTGSGISKPVIRGLGYNRVVVVDDGVRQEGQQWGDEHGIEIDPQTVGSVEILKGPASLMYGSDAMAGVLVMHGFPTPARGTVVGNASTEYHSNNGLFAYSVNAAGNQGGFVWSSRYSDKMAHDYKNKYDGYVYGTGFRERAFTQLLGLNRSWGYSHINLSYYHLTPDIAEGERDEKTGAFVKPALVGGEEVDQIATKDDFKSYGHGLPYQQIHHYKAVWDNTLFVGDGSLNLLVAYQQNRRQEFEEAAAPKTPGLDLKLQTVNYNLRYLSPSLGDLHLAAGVGGMYQLSENEGTEFLIPNYNLFDYGVYATATRDFTRWHVSGGVRFDNRHIRGHALVDDGNLRFKSFSHDFTGATGSIGVTFNATQQLNIRLNLSRGFRAPNISELSANGVHEGTARYELGNPDLKAENSWQIDLGADYSSAWFSCEAALFANHINNYIFTERMAGADGKPVITEDVPTYRYTSGDARLVGGELMTDIHPVEQLHWENTFSYVSAVQLHRPDDEKYLPLTPAPRWTSDLRYDFIRDGRLFTNTFAAFGVECNLRQNHYYKAYGTETATPSYTLLNFSMGTDLKMGGRRAATLVFSANNLTDRAYQSHLSRLKYTDINNATGRMGIFNMGRSFDVKLILHI